MEIRWHTCAGRLPVRVYFLRACGYIGGTNNNLFLSVFACLFIIIIKSQNLSRELFVLVVVVLLLLRFERRGRTRTLARVRFSGPISLSLSLVPALGVSSLRAKKKYVSDPLFFSLKRTHKTQQVRRIRRTKEARFSSTFTSRIRTRSNLRR